ncbi:RNA pseudouridine synthase [Falsiroseomonas bella]|uniref:RNA pseudouridine synthase n=1 Tax=Falsiroseomonas bella TaxID=2184016 RepID=A0A317F8B0_9PROT|nr:RNA pseudouridine synthase [Falsiroseomonas bella]PWS34257.1 RNA pseudouridine synthase [Falsiroseomonas bella]
MGRGATTRPPEPPLPDWLRARLLHVGPELLVLDKPSGMPVSARSGESLEHWLPALRMGKRRDPQPAHRLDADTAGCLVLGRTAPMLARLNALFAERRVGKLYWAILRGTLRGEHGTVDAPLRKVSTAASGWRMQVHAAGDPARTAWRILGRAPGLTFVELRPETGRTHQLRVHCAHLGAPILGDAMYGGGPGSLHLLAREIALPLDPPIRVAAPVPGHMRDALAACSSPG